MADKIIEALFETKAVRVAPENQPFWYTSGRLGPFFINTHFLLENEAAAGEVLKRIEKAIADNKLTAPEEIFDMMLAYYNKGGTFKMVSDKLAEEASKLDFDYISGGERRDYFFSMMPAYLLKKPHLTIYKDMTSVYSESIDGPAVDVKDIDLKGKKALHIADLITEASSYERAWIPVIRGLGSDITDTVAVVDRHQNGREVLKGLGVELHALTGINEELFDEAKANGVINDAQKDMIMHFLENPADYMTAFLKANPGFIDAEIAKGGKNKERAELAIEKGFTNV
ncbi:MAG: orotate phosphoribosyltransferase [Clostridiales bacterium]|jgi:orotate phosphoribosyltransferase|nr:orotate phosphoribosyltransferase [Clostridiales bacterium]